MVGPFRSNDEPAREIDGKRCVLETALRADVALLGATVADLAGNLTWRDGERNANEVMAYAADLVVVEADEIIVLADGRIVRSGGRELALELEEKGYAWTEPAGARK
mgnify:CR=1 FL=1